MNDVLEAQITEHTGAARYGRGKKRQAFRNGYRRRPLKAWEGALASQSRDGSFSTELFSRYQRSEQAVVWAIIEMVLQGISTRKAPKKTDALCGIRFSKSTVSRLRKQSDTRVAAFRERLLAQVAYPFVLVDAMVIKVMPSVR